MIDDSLLNLIQQCKKTLENIERIEQQLKTEIGKLEDRSKDRGSATKVTSSQRRRKSYKRHK